MAGLVLDPGALLDVALLDPEQLPRGGTHARLRRAHLAARVAPSLRLDRGGRDHASRLPVADGAGRKTRRRTAQPRRLRELVGDRGGDDRLGDLPVCTRHPSPDSRAQESAVRRSVQPATTARGGRRGPRQPVLPDPGRRLALRLGRRCLHRHLRSLPELVLLGIRARAARGLRSRAGHGGRRGRGRSA